MCCVCVALSCIALRCNSLHRVLARFTMRCCTSPCYAVHAVPRCTVPRCVALLCSAVSCCTLQHHQHHPRDGTLVSGPCCLCGLDDQTSWYQEAPDTVRSRRPGRILIICIILSYRCLQNKHPLRNHTPRVANFELWGPVGEANIMILPSRTGVYLANTCIVLYSTNCLLYRLAGRAPWWPWRPASPTTAWRCG